MRIGFYIPTFEHLGVAYLSASLREAGHETMGFYDPLLFNDPLFSNSFLARFLDMEDCVIERILEAEIDLLAFSVVTDRFSSACRIARKVKARRNITTVFGGIHCSSVPERVVQRPEVDFVVVGEGEHAIVELAGRLETDKRAGEIANVWHRRNGEVFTPPRPLIQDLDELPFPDRTLITIPVPLFMQARCNIIASRGCPFSCTYCNNSRMRELYRGKGTWRRRRSVDNVIEELRRAAKAKPFYYVRFWDEVFIDDVAWLREFADKYPAAVGKPFSCWGHSRFVTEESAALLQQAGCDRINIGVETIREETRRLFLRRSETNGQIMRAINLLRDTSIVVTTGNILGLPGQSLNEGVEMARFYNENRVDIPFFYYFRPYPRTAIVAMAQERGLLSQAQVEAIEDPTTGNRDLLHPSGEDTRDFIRVRGLLQLTRVAPPRLLKFFLKGDRWRRFPAVNLSPVITVTVGILRCLRLRRRGEVRHWEVCRYLYASLVFALQKCAWRFLRVLKPR